MEAIKKWLRSNSTSSRLTRTIFQAVVGVLIANIDFLIAHFSFSPEMKSFIVALCMAILSPLMAYLGGKEVVPDGK
jgi:hypothetical protein